MRFFRHHRRLLTFLLLLLLPLQASVAALMSVQSWGQGTNLTTATENFLPPCHNKNTKNTKMAIDSPSDESKIQKCETCSLCHLARQATPLSNPFPLFAVREAAPLIAAMSVFCSHIICPEHRPPIAVFV